MRILIVGERSKSLAGTLHISTSVAFGRRVLAPLLMEFMGSQPQLKVDLVCNDDYVDLVTHGVDVALRMGRLSDSSLGCRYITHNPWVMVAAPGYLAGRSEPRCPADLKHHECIVYSSVQGDAVWQLRSKAGVVQTVAVKGSLSLKQFVGPSFSNYSWVRHRNPAAVRCLGSTLHWRHRSDHGNVQRARTGSPRGVSVLKAGVLKGSGIYRVSAASGFVRIGGMAVLMRVNSVRWAHLSPTRIHHIAAKSRRSKQTDNCTQLGQGGDVLDPEFRRRIMRRDLTRRAWSMPAAWSPRPSW